MIILRDIANAWLNARWYFVAGVMFAFAWSCENGRPLAALVFGILLISFMLWTWPRRWLLDILILWLVLEQIVERLIR